MSCRLLLLSLLAVAAPADHQAFVPPTSPFGTSAVPGPIHTPFGSNPARRHDEIQDSSRLFMKKGFELYDLFYDDVSTALSA